MTHQSLLKKFLDKSDPKIEALVIKNIKNTPPNVGNYTKDTSNNDLSKILSNNIIAAEISTQDFSGYFNNESQKDPEAKSYLDKIESRVQEILSELIKDQKVIKQIANNDHFRLVLPDDSLDR